MKRILFFLTLFFIGASLHAQLNPDDIILYLDFDDNLNDSSGNGIVFNESDNSTNSITYEAGAPFTGSGSSGNFNESIYVSTTEGFFNHANSHTIAAWIYIDQLPSVAGNGFTILHQKDVAGQDPCRIHLEILQNGELISSLSTNVRVSDINAVQTGTWYHVASVVDKTDSDPANHTHALYVNGVMVETLTSGTESNSGALVLGAFKNEIINSFVGNMDDFLITDQVLTVTEINDIMNNGVAAEILTTKDISAYDKSLKINISNGILTYESTLEITKAAIFNMAGQKVFQVGNSKNINIQNLNAGGYILRLQSTNGVAAKKFVKR